MPGSNPPGPLGSNPSPRPGPAGPAGTNPPAAGSIGAAVPISPSDLDPVIEALNLRGAAKRAAYALKKAHPSVKFTSGRRNKVDQARAMASNVVRNRKWIAETYLVNVVSKACQKWVDDNPTKKTQDEIAAGLLSVFDATADADLSRISKHLSGDAFDIQPVEKDAEAIKATIRSLEGLDRFLDKEGGLVRWHAQF
jgi:hypothetical protein